MIRSARLARSIVSAATGARTHAVQMAKLSTAVRNPIELLKMPKHGQEETDEEHDQRYIQFFSRKDIDGWEIRKALQMLHSSDLVPDPAVVTAALKACRANNDIALCIRFLEAIKFKAIREEQLYHYVIQEIKPTLDELGIPTLEELGWDKPELAFNDE